MVNKRKKTKNKGILHLFPLVAVLLCVLIFVPKDSELSLGTYQSPTTAEIILSPLEKLDYTKFIKQLDTELYCKYAYICSADPHSAIAEKNSQTKASPASLTKIMATVILLENADNLQAEVTVSPQIYDALYREGAAMAGFLPGEKVTLYDLLCGTMLPSGAEALAAAADYVVGGEDKLVWLMNQKVLDMGLSNTHFENIYGFDGENHYSNASEMAQILMYAIKSETFREITGKKSYYVKPTNKHADGLTLKSSVFGKIGNKRPDEAVILGGKTGYTYDAGLCLATYGEKNGKTYVTVVMGVEGNHRTEQYQVDDTMFLYNLI